jgi:hypothetical protein
MASPFANDQTLGVDLLRVDDVPAFKLGTKVIADDGHDYFYARASANIAAAGTVALTDPAFGTTAGATFTAANNTIAVTSGQYFWARQVAL